MNSKEKALRIHLDLEDDDEIIESSYDDCIFTIGREEWLVLSDDEADQRYEEYLNNYIDEVIFLEIPESYHIYFNDDRWKDDARCNGSRGDLSGYDRNEWDVDVDFIDDDGVEKHYTYFLYRIN